MRNVLSSVVAVAFAGLLLAACDDAPQQQGSNSSSSTTAQATSSPAPVEETRTIWPPVPDTAVAIESDLLKLNIMVVYDGSGSMDYDACGAPGTRHQVAVPAVKQFVDAVPVEANLGLFVFDSNGIDLRVPLVSNNKDKFNAALDQIRIGDGTPLKSAITKAYYVLERQAQAQLGYGRYILLVVTDGEASSGQSPTRTVNFLVDNTPVEVHTVGLCIEGKHSLNQPGRTFYTKATNPDQLIAGLKSALAEATEDSVTFD